MPDKKDQSTAMQLAQRIIDRECTCTRCREATRREQLESVKRAIAPFEKGRGHALHPMQSAQQREVSIHIN
jgi:hypothetical protein